MESWCSKAGFRAISLADPSLNEFRGGNFFPEFLKSDWPMRTRLKTQKVKSFSRKDIPIQCPLITQFINFGIRHRLYVVQEGIELSRITWVTVTYSAIVTINVRSWDRAIGSQNRTLMIWIQKLDELENSRDFSSK